MNNSIKNSLNIVLKEFNVNKEELHYLTGYDYEEVTTKEDLQEIRRLLEIMVY